MAGSDDKVFDVSKPKADPTSKPVIIGHKIAVSDSTIKKEDGDKKPAVDPLNNSSEEPAIKVSESKLSPTSEKTLTPSAELVEEVKEQKAEEEKTQAPETEEHRPSVETEPSKEEPEKESQNDEKPNEQVGNESAVNTVLGQAGDAKQAEIEQLEKEEKVKKLVDEGKYSLPIGQPRKHRGKVSFLQGMLILAFVFLLTIIGFALAADAELIKTNYKLPFDLIKKSQPADETVTPTAPTPTPSQTTTVKDYTKTTCLKPVTQGDLLVCSLTDLGVKFSYPSEWNFEGVVKTAKTAQYETKIGTEEGVYKFDSTKKQWINKSTNTADYTPTMLTTNKSFTVFDLGGDVDVGGASVSGCHFSKLAFEVKDSIVIVDGSTACAATTNTDGSTAIKYTITQQTKDIEAFTKSIQEL